MTVAWDQNAANKSLPVEIPHFSSPKVPFAPYTGASVTTESSQADKDKMNYVWFVGGITERVNHLSSATNPHHLGCLKLHLKSLPDSERFCPQRAKGPGKALTGFTAPVPPKITSRPSAAPGTPQTGGSRKRRGEDMEVDGRENGVDEMTVRIWMRMMVGGSERRRRVEGVVSTSFVSVGRS
ncbi:hypothetical protein VKT23_009689 [Stygiomarasmius scandens]|uniref:Uncharacterized protein n=1 Tax=Marasmiellus scandens TaxID=2682957 RepID=A0ABR1JDW9_9AGAR